jgi:oxalate decarboxylase/phosphoglucose isomerase-like protein (cupin superfamily)
MIDLQLSTGLPIKFDEENERFHHSDEVVYDKVNRVHLSSMLPGLLNKSLRYPEYVYEEYQNIRLRDDEKKFQECNEYHYDLLFLPSGLMGIEYIRSHIFFSKHSTNDEGVQDISEIIEVVTGNLTVLLQKNAPQADEFDLEPRVSEGLVIKLTKGEKFCIPSGFYYTFINTSEESVVFTRLYAANCITDYSKESLISGPAYYAIKKNAREEFVLNPRYRDIPEIKESSADQLEFMRRLDLEDECLYKQIIKRGKRLSNWF